MMKRKTHALAAGIIPFLTAVPLPVTAKSAPTWNQLGTQNVSVTAKSAIAGFPELLPNPIVAAKTVKCPPTPSKPTKKCKP